MPLSESLSLTRTLMTLIPPSQPPHPFQTQPCNPDLPGPIPRPPRPKQHPNRQNTPNGLYEKSCPWPDPAPLQSSYYIFRKAFYKPFAHPHLPESSRPSGNSPVIFPHTISNPGPAWQPASPLQDGHGD